MFTQLHVYMYTCMYENMCRCVHVYTCVCKELLNVKHFPSQAHGMGRCIHGSDLKKWSFEAVLWQLEEGRGELGA